MGDENKLSNYHLVNANFDIKNEVFDPKGHNNVYVSLKGKKTLPPESEMEKILDLSQTKL